jgi:cytochrome c oxidase cbb3-type subunit 3
MPHQQRIRVFWMAALFVCFGFFLSPSVNAAGKPDAQAQGNVQKGNALFQQSCAACHGTGAMGGIGPNLLASPIVREPVYYGGTAALVIQGGRADRGMPAFPSLTDTDISDILAFLQARILVFDKESGSDRAASLKRLLTGNAADGKRFFYGQGQCSTCHSPTGDLAGIASKYEPEDLQRRFLYPPDDNATAVVSLPNEEKIEGKLLHLDAFYVAIQDEKGQYRSWPLQQVKVQVNDPLKGHLELLGKYTNKDMHNVFAYLETLK